jgi:hypothetical protein
MKLSESTLEILKNFSSINMSILFKKGNKIRTVAPGNNILAQATVSESFPNDFGIYELNQFLGLVSLFENADLDFGDKFLTVKDGVTKAVYAYSDPVNIKSPPDKNLELPSVEVEFKLTKEVLKKITNGSNQLQLPNIVVRGKDGEITLVATDVKNPNSNEFSEKVGTTEKEFQFVFKSENLKFISDEYNVRISKKGISHFVGPRIEYWVAIESSSNYSE